MSQRAGGKWRVRRRGRLWCRRERGGAAVELAASRQRVVVAAVVEFGLWERASREIGLVVWVLEGGGICGWL